MPIKNFKKYYVERDVSWMYFNYRILQEAEKEDEPLLERLGYLGIYSNNLDEFFRVRVAAMSRYLDEPTLDKATHHSVKKSLQTINKLNERYGVEYAEAVDHVFAELQQHGIRLINEQQLNEEQKAFLRDFYYDRLNGNCNPIWLHQIDNIATLEDNRIYLVVERQENDAKQKTKYAIVKVPDRQVGRWVRVPSSDGFENIMYLDDVVRYCMPFIFLGLKPATYRAYSFKFTKDAEMEIDNDQDYGTLEKIKAGVDSRKRGDAVRVIYDREMPRDIQKRILERLDIDELDTSLAGGRYQNHKDLMSFPDCGHKELKYDKWTPVMKPEFLSEDSLLDAIREKDRFIHVPYHSFDGYIRVLQEAAIKPEVKAIKTTLYRLAKDSKVVKALITAARNGKKVTAVVELLARFDEESNIKWSKRMQDEGVNVIFGVEGLKIHSKLLYVESKKGNIAVVGTGNFHEGNAKHYTDYFMMTARPRIVNEVEKVFEFIDRPFIHPRFQELLVSPNAMKTRILRMLDNEIKNARAGQEAWLKMKINHITDKDVVEKLYEASAVGVKIDICIRGNCSLVPGIPGVSDNIRCVGIIDRYLEHSRILIFCNGGKNKYYLGSADWMPRNLLSRIEVYTPVYDPDLRADLLRTVEYGMKDNTNGRIVDGLGTNEIPGPQNGEPPFRSQQALHDAYTLGLPSGACACDGLPSGACALQAQGRE
ncbi:MAG: RNA degradosome polyphosphate kinase [Prevotella sp.]|nr:RNA degradosome polyphosphate kinase [Prevotella sp.]